jgi:dihydroorotate dehydrogenase
MSLYDSVIRPTLFRLPTETAHEIGIDALRYGLAPEIVRRRFARRLQCDQFGELQRFGLKFKNPLGIAAGFDKNGIVVNQLAALGFGFVEVGTVTYRAQPGNEKPRLFRLPADQALINRLGFNNDGTPAVIDRLKKIRPDCVLGVNIGKNKDVPNAEAIENYLASFKLAREVADYITVNVSSPNTANLRELQKAESLEELLKTLQADNPEKVPLLVKIAPDLTEAEIESVVDVALRLGLAGIIATNTTTGRAGLRTQIDQTGGLSGKPLANLATQVISKLHRHSCGKIPIIGVGGIFTAEDAFEKIAAGASLLQAYTGFVYCGLTFARDVNFGLARILREKGFRSLDEAVGSKEE